MNNQAEPDNQKTLRILGIGVQDFHDSLMRDGFKGSSIFETRDRNIALKMIEEGKVDVVIYNICEGYEEIDKLLGKKSGLYVAKTLGWTPKLNPQDVYRELKLH